MSENILPTKLYMPPLRPLLVPRPRLIRRLEEQQNGKLTLVAAPAGFGKTTLVAAWLAEEDAAGRPQPAAWLSLDENDNQFQRFFTYFIAAAQTVHPGVGQGLLASLQTTSLDDDDAIVPALLHELATSDRPLLVVLDDYHLIDNEAIHGALGAVIDAMPPWVRLLITSRDEPPLPLSRWRVRGQLTEIGATDLRFTEDEAAAFLRQTMGLALDESAVATLGHRTEGWVAGLQLAALTLRDERDSRRFIDQFGGSDRHVTDYLLEEVLFRQPAAVQSFLLQTSILDRFCAPLCDAVVAAGHETVGDGPKTQPTPFSARTSQEILEYLETANLFLIPLDRRRRWYRYHHLFGQLLRDRLARELNPAQVAGLHLRASAWFAANGLLEEAVTHAIKGHDFDRAARLISMLPSDSLWDQGNSDLLIKWEEFIPTDSLLRHPRSLISIAAAYLITGQVQPVHRLMALAEGVESVYGEYALLKCTLVRNQGDFVQALHLAQEAGEFLPEDAHTLRAMALMQIVTNVARLGDLEQAERAILQARALVDKAEEVSPNTYLQVIQIQGIVSLFGADYTRAQRLFQEGLALAGRMPGATPPMVGMIHAELGRVHYEWNELAEAAAQLAQAQSWAERTGISDIRLAVLMGEMRLACQRGDAAAAEPYLMELRQFAQNSRLEDIFLQVESQIALYRLYLGQVDEAIRWANASGFQLADRPDNAQRLHYQVLVAVRLAECRALGARDGLAEMSALLQHMIQQAQAGHYQHDLIELLILQALVLDYDRDRPAARQALQQALDLGQGGSLVRTFLDAGPALAPLLAQLEGSYAARLVQEFKREPYAPEGQQAAIEMLNLTPREVEILQEIAAGLSNKEIEARLVISRNTVRTHIKNLYSKLQVNSRAQAISKAHELGLF